MKRSNRLVLLIGIFLALVAFVLIVLLMGRPGGPGSPSASASASPTTVQIVVAAADISLGSTIQASDVKLESVSVSAKPGDAFLATSAVIGQIVRKNVTAGEQITSRTFNTSGSINDIVVPQGFVAMSVRVNQTTGVGTIIKPGDFVDVVTGFTDDNIKLVMPDPEETVKLRETTGDNNAFVWKAVDQSLYNPTTIKTLAQGLQVLGTLLPPPPQQQQPQGGNAPAPTATPSTGGASTDLNEQEEIVILAVPTQVAEVLKFSEIDGNVSLVLRSAKDCTTKPADGLTYCPAVATTGITLKRMVDDWGVLPPQIVQVVQPTPIPGTLPEKAPKP